MNNTDKRLLELVVSNKSIHDNQHIERSGCNNVPAEVLLSEEAPNELLYCNQIHNNSFEYNDDMIEQMHLENELANVNEPIKLYQLHHVDPFTIPDKFAWRGNQNKRLQDIYVANELNEPIHGIQRSLDFLSDDKWLTKSIPEGASDNKIRAINFFNEMVSYSRMEESPTKQFTSCPKYWTCVLKFSASPFFESKAAIYNFLHAMFHDIKPKEPADESKPKLIENDTLFDKVAGWIIALEHEEEVSDYMPSLKWNTAHIYIFLRTYIDINNTWISYMNKRWGKYFDYCNKSHYDINVDGFRTERPGYQVGKLILFNSSQWYKEICYLLCPNIPKSLDQDPHLWVSHIHTDWTKFLKSKKHLLSYQQILQRKLNYKENKQKNKIKEKEIQRKILAQAIYLRIINKKEDLVKYPDLFDYSFGQINAVTEHCKLLASSDVYPGRWFKLQSKLGKYSSKDFYEETKVYFESEYNILSQWVQDPEVKKIIIWITTYLLPHENDMTHMTKIPALVLKGSKDTGKSHFIRKFLLAPFANYAFNINEDKSRETMADGSFIENTCDVFLMENFNRIKNIERAQQFSLFVGCAQKGFEIYLRGFKNSIAIDRPIPVVITTNTSPEKWFANTKVHPGVRANVLSRLRVIDCDALTSNPNATVISNSKGEQIRVISPFKMPREREGVSENIDWYQLFWSYLIHSNNWDFKEKVHIKSRRERFFDQYSDESDENSNK